MQAHTLKILARTTTGAMLAMALALPACKSTDSTSAGSAQAGKGRISNEFVATAQVVPVESASRIITLKREDGSQIRVKASEAVRNFDQIAAGDTLRVKYKETLQATRLPPDADITKGAVAVAAGRAEKGAKPAGGLGVALSLCVKITSIDREHNVVVFSLASGELIARDIVTAEGREFVKGLKVGDVVQLDYAEELALSIEKL